jgi:hypothetical protein
MNETTPSAGSPDIADLLRRHAAKEPLTSREFGILGAHAAKLRRAGLGNPSGGGPPRRKAPHSPMGAGGPMPGVSDSGLAVPNTGGNPLFASPDTVPAGSVDSAPHHPSVDPAATRAVVGALVDAADRLAQSYVRVATVKAGGDEGTANRFATAASCPPESRRLIVDTSPEYVPAVLGALGLSGAAVPGGAAIVGVAGWGIGLLGVATEIRQLSPAGAGKHASGAPSPESGTLGAQP